MIKTEQFTGCEFIRYGVKVLTDGHDPKWVSIGTGYDTNVKFAHLYTTWELAQKKALSELKAHKDWMKHTGMELEYVIVEFRVQ